MTRTIAHDGIVTADGYAELCSELEVLRGVRRAELTDRLRQAHEERDAESPVLYELLEEHAQLAQRIAELEAQVARARVARPTRDGSAGIGSRVRVRHADDGQVADYELVGVIESGIGNGRVSVDAPVGRALVGRRRGDTVVAETPRGAVRLEILGVAA